MLTRKPVSILVLLGALVLALAGAGFAAAQDEAKPFLGVGLDSDKAGALVAQVLPDGPAAEAGIEVGDVITAINGEAVTVETIRDALAQYAVGDTITLEVQRDTETLSLEVTLAARPVEEPTVNIQILPDMASLFGLSVERTDDGLVVREVTADSPAAQAGFEVGDMIEKVGDTEISRPADLLSALRNFDPTQPLAVEVQRGGETVTLELSLSDMFIPFGGQRGMPFGDGRRSFRMPFNMPFSMMGSGARLGVMFVTLDEQTAQARSIEQSQGALITEVIQDSPAAAAGLQVDDIVTAGDGDKVDVERTLRDRLLAYEPGDTVTLTVLRGGESLEVPVTLDAAAGGGMMMPRGFRFFGPEGFVHPPIPAQPEEPEATVQPNA